jgi:hypothetical protein
VATTFSEPRLVRGKDLREAAVIAFAVLLVKTCPVSLWNKAVEKLMVFATSLCCRAGGGGPSKRSSHPSLAASR